MSKILENIFDMVSDGVVAKPDGLSKTVSTEDSLITPVSQKKTMDSIIKDLKARQPVKENENAGSNTDSDELAQILQQRYKKRGVLISYDIKGCFQMKQVVCKVIEDLKQLGFEDDIWFDKDEGKTTSNASFAQRLESAEECNAAIMFISRQYFITSPGKYEAEIFTQRNGDETSSGNPFRVFTVKYSEAVSNPADFLDVDVDLTSRSLRHASLAEKAATVVGALCGKLESYVTFSTKLYRELCADVRDASGHRGYKEKLVYTWGIQDVQEWLGSLGIHERYRVSFEENEIDGYLLESLKECDILEYLNVDNKAARQKILFNLGNVLERETSWDKSCERRKTRDNNVYLVCDPRDAWIAEFIKSDLVKAGIMARMHSASEFSKSSARLLAEAATVIFLLTSSSEASHVVFKEILMAAWLDKHMITAVFDRDCITSARCGLKAIVAKQPAINFVRDRYLEGLDVLRYHVTRGRGVMPRVILQQHYVEKMRDGLKPLHSLLHETSGAQEFSFNRPKVFLSYHWDMQSRVGKIKEFLDRNGCETTTDASRPIAVSIARPYREYSSLLANHIPALVHDGISRATVVILCITLKYLHCDNFIKDTQLAELHKKLVVPVLLQWCPHPLERVTAVAKRLDMTSALIDMSNEQQFRKNLPKLLELITKKCVK